MFENPHKQISRRQTVPFFLIPEDMYTVAYSDFNSFQNVVFCLGMVEALT